MGRDLIGHGQHVLGNDDLIHRWMHDDEVTEFLLECHWHWHSSRAPTIVARTSDPLTCTACIARRPHVR